MFSPLSVMSYDYLLYDGKTAHLAPTVQSWSWGQINFKNSDVIYPEEKYSVSIGCDYSTGLYFHGSLVFEFRDMSTLSFLIRGKGGGENLKMQLEIDGTGIGKAVTVTASDKWISTDIDFLQFFNGTGPLPHDIITGLHISSPPTSTANDTVYLTNITVSSRMLHHNASVTLDVDTKIRSFSHLIFGANFVDSVGLSSYNYSANRWGGNAVTRYAWDLDVQNRADDWYFEDLPNTVNVSQLPYNTSSDKFITDTFKGGSVPIVTLPTIGWSPFDRQPRCGFSISKYGPQKDQDTERPSLGCGNGVKTDGTEITGNDPKDTSKVVDETYVLQWLSHLKEVFDHEQFASMKFIFDNEPNFWSSTHRDVRPNPITYDELWAYTVSYGSAIKAKYPSIELMGPDISGYCHLFFSPADGFCSIGDDRKAHDNLPLIQWFIQELASYYSVHGVKLLDWIDIHCYPEGIFPDNEEIPSKIVRLRSPREMWDPTYVAESWYVAKIWYIRQIKQWIDLYAPWLKISCTEYNYGNDDSVSAAIANVEAFCVYAREGVDLATRWTMPKVGSITESAFKMLSNYDGQHSGLLQTPKVIHATSTDDSAISVYGFTNGEILHVVLVCKNMDRSPTATNVDLTSFATTGKADVYRLDMDHNGTLVTTLSFSSPILSVDIPPVSATLLVVRKS